MTAVLALDVARATDFSALVAVDAPASVLSLDRWKPRPTWTDVVEKTLRLTDHPALRGAPVVVDASAEGGRQVLQLLARDLLAEVGLYGAVPTRSTKPPKQLKDGRIVVSKRDFVAVLVDAVSSGRLRVPATPPNASILLRELDTFRAKRDESGFVR